MEFTHTYIYTAVTTAIKPIIILFTTIIVIMINMIVIMRIMMCIIMINSEYIDIGMHIHIYCDTFVCRVEHASQLSVCTKSPLCLR